MKRILVLLVAFASVNAIAQTKTMDMPFEQCVATRENLIASLNVNPRDIIPVVNTGMITMTRICTSDGSVLISCSKPDAKMVIQTNKKRGAGGCH